MSEFKLPTEVVELPSKGLLYPEDSELAKGTVEIKYMTAKEEDILTNQSYIKNGTVLDKLLKSVIVSKINFDDLLIGDKNAIMIAARVLGYGKDYEVKIETPSGEAQTEIIDLTAITNKDIDESLITPGENRFKLTLPISKRVIEIKLLSHNDEKYIEDATKTSKKYNRMRGIDNNVTLRLGRMILSVDGNTDQNFIHDFIENYFLSRDVQYVREFISKVQPDVDLTMSFTDQATGEDFELQLPIGLDFFWPGARV
jgi:hypothetical protein